MGSKSTNFRLHLLSAKYHTTCLQFPFPLSHPHIPNSRAEHRDAPSEITHVVLLKYTVLQLPISVPLVSCPCNFLSSDKT